MAEYIERKAALDAIMGARTEFARMNYFVPNEFTRNQVLRIKSVPAADVRENVRGEYIGDYDGYADGNPVYDIWSCSKCGCVYEGWDEKPTYNFCPNCGADMRRKGGNDDDSKT